MKTSDPGNWKKISLSCAPSIIALLAIFLLVVSSGGNFRSGGADNFPKAAFLKGGETKPLKIINGIEILNPLANKAEAVQKNKEGLAAAPDENSGAEEESLSDQEQPAQESENQESQNAASPEEETGEEEAAEEEAPPVPRADLIIGVVADAHAGQSNGWSKLSAFAWRMSGYEHPDIIVSLGDLIESRRKQKRISEDEAEADYKKARYMISRYPVYNTVGNHEVLSMSVEDIEKITGRNNYYSARVKGYNLIFLDTTYTKSGKNIDADNSNKSVYTGTIPDSQKDWLRGKLKESDKNIIFVHHPLYNITNENEIEDVIDDNEDRIIMIANGHKHPSSLRVSRFGGVKSYDIPSLENNGQYVIITINGESEVVTPKRN